MKYCHIFLRDPCDNCISSKTLLTLSVDPTDKRCFTFIELFLSGRIQIHSGDRSDDRLCRDVHLDDNGEYIGRSLYEEHYAPITDYELKFLEIALHIASSEKAKDYLRKKGYTFAIGKNMDAEVASRKKGAIH